MRRPGLPAVLVALVLATAPAAAEQEELTAEQQRLNLESFDHVWTTIRDKHFDPELGGLDWTALRDKLRPRVAEATTMDAARGAMEELIESLGQSHFAIIPSEVYEALSPSEESGAAPGDGTTGIDLRVVGTEALVTGVEPGSPAERAGVKRGWAVTRIRDRELAPRLAAIAEEFADSTYREGVLSGAVLGRLTGPVGDKIALQLLDGNGTAHDLELELVEPRGWKRQFGHLPPLHVRFDSERLADDIGYIAFNSFLDPSDVMPAFNEAMQSFLDTSGLVIDIRGNGGGLPTMVMGMAGWLIPEKGRHLGTAYFRETELKILVFPRARTYDGPLAVLVDGLSASASEMFSGGLKDLGRACIVGTRTMGASLPSAVEKLPNGDGFQYVFADYVSASGERLEGAGVAPDIEVAPTREALLEGKDAVLEAALQWIREQNETPAAAAGGEVQGGW